MSVPDLYFKKSTDRGGKVYMRVHSRKNGYVANIGSPEKAVRDSVRLKELEEQTEKYNKLLTEIKKGD